MMTDVNHGQHAKMARDFVHPERREPVIRVQGDEVPRLSRIGNEDGVSCQSGMRVIRRTRTQPKMVFPDAGKFTSGISAEQFVAKQSQVAGANRNKEAISRASCSHAPKLRLGETHVPVDFLARREKKLPVVVMIRYARY